MGIIEQASRPGVVMYACNPGDASSAKGSGARYLLGDEPATAEREQR